jgi:hypothetical protein
MASKPSVALRLGMTGKEEIKSGFVEIGDSGTAQAKRWSAAFERAGQDATAALERQAEAAKKIASFTPRTAAQSQIDSSVGTGYSGGSAQASAAAFSKLLAEQERQAEAVRNAIDPLRVAQAAYDRELEVANSLLRSGNINQSEHARVVALATTTFDRAKQSLNGVDAAHKGVSVSGQIMQHVFRSTGDSIAAGLPLTMVFGEQIGRIGEAAALSGGKFAALGAFLSTPWGAAITIGVTVLSPFIGKLFETGEAAKAAEKQLKAFEDRQADMGRFIDSTTGKLKEQNRQLALIAKMQLPAQINAQAGTTQGFVNQAFATARGALGGQDNFFSTDLISKGRADLQAAIDSAGGNVQKLRRSLDDLAKTNPSLKGVADQVAGLAGQAAEAAQQIGTLQSHQRDLNTALSGGSVITKDAVEHQIALATATTAVERAQLRLKDATEGWAKVEAMQSGPAKTKAAAQYAADVIAATNAVKAAETAQKALSKAQREGAADAKREAAERATLTEHMSRLNLQPGIEENWKSFRADAEHVFVELDEAQKKRGNMLQTLVKQDASQRDTLQLSALELATIGMSADKRQVILDTFAKQQELQRDGVDLESDNAKQILAGVAAQDAMNAQLARASATMDEVRNFGSQFVDDLMSGRNVTKDLVAEFIKLAAINPLKNLINGNSALPTWSSAIGSIGKLFGGGSSLSGIGNTSLSAGGFAVNGGIGANAGGTDYWRGGLTWVAENGPELINLPRGSSVSTASQTRQMFAANNNEGVTHNHFHLEGAVVTQDLLDQMNAIGAGAAAQGAYGGATLAQAKINKRRSRAMR